MSLLSASRAPTPGQPEPAIRTRAVRVDPDSGMAIWELRDPLTGRVLAQYPSERSLAAYRDRFPAHPAR